MSGGIVRGFDTSETMRESLIRERRERVYTLFGRKGALVQRCVGKRTRGARLTEPTGRHQIICTSGTKKSNNNHHLPNASLLVKTYECTP